MDWMYVFYFLLGTLLFFGARGCKKGEWNEEYTSLSQTKTLLGFTALCVSLHHMGQKSCAPWHPSRYIVHGLDFFVPIGYILVSVFLFCSGLGLYKSWKTKPDYLRHFPRKRILPIVAAFYLSEWFYLLVRYLMGEKMDAGLALEYFLGLRLANFNAWYVMVIPFFYLAFYFAFRFCRREGWAILWVFLFTLGYTVLGAAIDHRTDQWFAGEWWYNCVILFPLGLLFAKHEEKITRFLKKGYWVYLILSFAAIFALNRFSSLVVDQWCGYYGENWGDPMKIPHRLASAASQWLVCVAAVAFCFLLIMKVRLGNKALKFLGGMTLEYYLIHGIFVELFGYNFHDISNSIYYIRSVPLFILAVLSCGIAASILFRYLWRGVMKLIHRPARIPDAPMKNS